MSRRWRDPAGFRPERASGTRSHPSRIQAVALLLGLVLVGGSVAAASYLVEPDRARSFDVVHGSLFLNDSVAPVAIDLASGRPTVRLIAANAQVHATSTADMSVVPMDNGTLLLNTGTGEFNMVDETGFVIKNDRAGGVGLPKTAQSGKAFAVSSGTSAYIVRANAAASSVYLVDQNSVRQAGSGAKSTARASRSLPLSASGHAGDAVTANGNLWLRMTDHTGTSRVVEFSVPTGAKTGGQLATTQYPSLSGALAIGTAATSQPAGSATAAASTVGVVTKDHIHLVDASGNERSVPFRAPAGLTEVVPASNATGKLSYLMRSTQGWSLLSVGVDGDSLRGPLTLASIPAAADLVPPAAAPNGSLYTMTTGSGQLLVVDPAARVSALPGTSTYPLVRSHDTVVERGGYTDAYAIGRGTRIVINSPVHNNAVVIFAESSKTTSMSVGKSSAVEVNAIGGVAALTTNPIPQPRPNNRPTTTPTPTRPQPNQPVTGQIDCSQTAQRPHVPLLSATQVGSRSVVLAWRYPLFDPQDCEPSTYVVKVSKVGDDAPPKETTVQGQVGVTLGGLSPDTSYLVTVTAVLNNQGAQSEPVQIHTTVEGPSAPDGDVTVTASDGGWTVTWTACSSGDCVPSASWRVTPQFCDGLGLSAPPAPSEYAASGGQQSVRIAADDATLGRSLSFVVEGLDGSGRVGTPSDATPCTRSWAEPNAAALALSPTAAAAAQPGDTVSVTATLDLGATPTRSVGGLGATVSFVLTGDGPPQSSGAITYDGSSAVVSTTFGSVQPGHAYSVYAVVTPPGQDSSASVSTAPQTVRVVASWPDLTTTATCADALLSCELSVTVTGVSSATANGDTFDLVNSSLVCGSTALPLSKTGYDPSTTTATFTVSQLDGFFGSCVLNTALLDNPASGTPVYGSAPQAAPQIPVELGTADVANLGAADLTASWGAGGADVTNTGATWTTAQLAALTKDWSETLTGPGNTSCGSVTDQPGPTTIAVDPACVQLSGDWTIAITYTNAVDGSTGTVSEPLTGTAPGYQPCVPDLRAAWGASINDPVTVTDADPANSGGCSGWAYTLQTPTTPATSCGTASGAPGVAITIDQVACPLPLPIGTWTVKVDYIDTARVARSVSVEVSGDPPTS